MAHGTPAVPSRTHCFSVSFSRSSRQARRMPFGRLEYPPPTAPGSTANVRSPQAHRRRMAHDLAPHLEKPRGSGAAPRSRDPFRIVLGGGERELARGAASGLSVTAQHADAASPMGCGRRSRGDHGGGSAGGHAHAGRLSKPAVRAVHEAAPAGAERSRVDRSAAAEALGLGGASRARLFSL
jgi:hypothetical protein